MSDGSPEDDDYADRFGGMGRLLGLPGLAKVRASHVCVIGVGGVGSWTVEALVRSGVGAVTMIDMDDVCITNVNRQLPALDGGIGRPKVEALADRMRLIHAGCAIHAVTEFFTASSAARLLSTPFDFVIDAVDRISTKVLIITECRTRGIPLLTVGGAGGRRDATAVRTADLAFSTGDNLLRGVRRKLRRQHGFPADDRQPFGISCVYSAEPQVFPWADGTCHAEPETTGAMKLDCASGFGAASFVTGVFGFAAAGEVVRRLAEKA
ncbi:MAG: tRNA threonylcarbamoyladenosine dehydratase [Verrucomicrobiaceae bacterium]|nr:MAG: tRNA threonylcarbamoyladenosine dehydratase [Verrucomicrobiaceae bacterium]